MINREHNENKIIVIICQSTVFYHIDFLKKPSSNCILLTVKLCLAILRAIYIFSGLVRKVKTFGNLIS